MLEKCQKNVGKLDSEFDQIENDQMDKKKNNKK